MADIAAQIEQLDGKLTTVLNSSKEAKEAASEASTKQKEMFAQLQELNNKASETAEWRKELEADNKKNQEALNGVLTEVKTMKEGGVMFRPSADAPKDFNTSFAKLLKDNFQDRQDQKGNWIPGISSVSSGRGTGKMLMDAGTMIPTKAASNMTTSGNLTGDSVFTYVPTPYLTPRQLVNVRDLVPTFQSATGHIVIYRENFNGGVSPESGAFGQQLTEGALKEQVGYNFTNVPFTANYLSGFVRISKQMLQDLPFLQTYLPGMLLRDYYKFENATFYTALVNAALGTPGSAGSNDAETLMNGIANLEGYNFAPNGIVTTPAEWISLLKTTYTTTPIGIMYNYASQNLEVAGIPILKATWVGADKAIIADWTQAQIAQVDGLRVEFFEQDSDNVQRNLITVRVEARVVFITGQPYAFTVQSL